TLGARRVLQPQTKHEVVLLSIGPEVASRAASGQAAKAPAAAGKARRRPPAPRA
ncbi:MAG: hypothetical protein RL227_2881, partial [Pseudomonadota bacterium]